MHQEFLEKLMDPNRHIYLYGTTPPHADASENAVDEMAKKLTSQLEVIDYDAIVVYDIQDESYRTQQPRPFPLKVSIDPRIYARQLSLHGEKPTITYKAVAQLNTQSFSRWHLETAHYYQQPFTVFVGTASHRETNNSLSLQQAYSALQQKAPNLHLGGVTIAERHAKKGDEHLRLRSKGRSGCEYFISQTVFDAEETIQLLKDYASLCHENGDEPKRFIMTFSPCGSRKKLDFMKWLGISIPNSVEQAICESDKPLQRSLEVCEDNLEKILVETKELHIPLGLNIESISSNNSEIEASINTFKALKDIMDRYSIPT